MKNQIIYHMAHQADWLEAREKGQPYLGSADDLRDGFIHFSTAEQIKISAAKHRFGQTDLLLIAVDAQRLGKALVWEANQNQLVFPHLYGTLDPLFALSATELPWNSTEQTHIFPPLHA